MTEWQAGTANKSAHNHLLILCLSWAAFMLVRCIELGFGVWEILIILGLGVYYWFARTKMGAEYLREAFIEREAWYQLMERVEL